MMMDTLGVQRYARGLQREGGYDAAAGWQPSSGWERRKAMGDVQLLAKTDSAGARVRLAATVCGLMAMVCASSPSLAGDAPEGAWIAPARVIKDGWAGGSGIYFRMGLVITAAHLTDAHADMRVHIAGHEIPVTVLRQGVLKDVDLSLLAIAKENMPVNITLPEVKLCRSPPWPGDPVLVVDAERATRSHIASTSPQLLPFFFRHRLTSLIADVATTGNSGSGVFDPNRKCLLGIMSLKLHQGNKDIVKYFVPANEIREFLPPEFRSPQD